MDEYVSGGHKYRDLALQVGDKTQGVKTGWFKTNLAESSEECCGSKGVVLPVMR
jgi:hypothetical protein